MARIGALVRRDRRRTLEGPRRQRLAIRDLVLDSQLRTAQRAATALELSPREFDLLWFLASHADRVYSREQLLTRDRKSTRLNSSHVAISYAVFCLKKKKRNYLLLNLVCLKHL